MLRSLGVVTIVGFSSAAGASVVLGTNAGFIIDGSEIHSSSIVIGPEYGTPIEDFNVAVQLIGFQHAYLGDLVVTLTHVESGRTATLFDSVGMPSDLFGSPAKLDGTYVFNDNIFNPANPDAASLWSAADAAGTGVIPTAFYYPTGYGSPSLVSLDAAFAGITSAGTWRLDVIDTFPAFDDGSLFKWVIVLTGTPVPAPGAIALLGLAGLVGGRRRRA